MITKDKYFEATDSIDLNSLPEALRNGHKLVQGASQNDWSAYNTNENIRRVVNAYFEKLEQWLKNNPTNKPEGKKTVTPKTEPKPKPLKKATAPKTKSEPKDKSNGEAVEKVSLEVSFIKRYAGLHGKTKTQDEILRFLDSLQKAMLEKRIRKTSPYASEIEKIQEQLIRCYEKMGDAVEINIDKKSLEHYLEIAGSQKAMLSVSYIRQYISLHGKKNVKDKAKVLMQHIKKAVVQKKLDNNDPYAARLDSIFKSLKNYVNGDSTTPQISKSELNGLMGVFSYIAKRNRKKKVARHLHKIYEIEHGMAGTENDPEEDTISQKKHSQVIPSTELASMEFETIGLQGKYRELIGDPCVGFSAMVFGLPKSGKSTLCIDFAKYLAEHHGKVLYCAIEEKFGYTLKEKVERLKAVHPKLYVAEEIPDNVSEFNFVFIDSVSRANLTIEDLNRLRSDYPKVAFIFIFHTTKNGQFRGQNQFAHDVDVIIEVKDGEAKGTGRFTQNGQIDLLK